MDIVEESVAKPVDEDWESFQVTKKQVEDQNKTETLPESSCVDSNLFKYNVNIVKQETNCDDSHLGECNVTDTTDFYLRAEVLELEQTACYISRSIQHNLPSVFSKKSKHKIVNSTFENMDVIAINAAKPINEGWKLSEVIKKEVKDENQTETVPETSRIDSNLSKHNVNIIKQEINNDDDSPLGECNNIDRDTFNPTNRDWPLHTEVMKVEDTTHCIIEIEDVIIENGVKPIEEDTESFLVIKKEAEDDNLTEIVPETSSVNSNLFQCYTYIKQEIHRDDDPLLCERNIIDTEAFTYPTDISLQSHLSVKKEKPKKKKPEKKKPKKKKLTWDNYVCCCAECGVECENISYLRQHSLQTHSCCYNFKCSDCSKVLPNYKSFIIHVYTHKKKLTNCCEFCNKRFNKPVTMKKHLTLAHRYDCLTMCPNCGMSFETLDELQNHILTYSKNYKEYNRKEQPRIQSDLKCEYCNKEFESLDNLQQHKLVHTEGGKDFPCHISGAKFFTDSMLGDHLLTHEAAKLYECEVCSKSYKTKHSLQSHIMSIHSAKKPFVCEQCGKTFRSKTHLFIHLRHHRKALHNCVHCQHQFTSHSYLKKHMQYSHNIKVDDKHE